MQNTFSASLINTEFSGNATMCQSRLHWTLFCSDIYQELFSRFGKIILLLARLLLGAEI